MSGDQQKYRYRLVNREGVPFEWVVGLPDHDTKMCADADDFKIEYDPPEGERVECAPMLVRY